MAAIACKAAGAVLILFSAGYFAKEINGRLEQRFKELRSLYSILLQMKSELQYMGNTLPECFRGLAKYTVSPFDIWFSEMAEDMEEKRDKSFSLIWEEKLKILYEDSALTNEDIVIMLELKDKLGLMDVSAQTKAIDYVLLQLEEHRKILQEEIKEKKKVVVTLSLFLGLMTLIILL